MGLESEDLKQYHGQSGGDFTSIKKLCKPGESIRVRLVDISKNYHTKFPLKDKEYCYRVSLHLEGGKLMLMDLAGRDGIAQIVTALYPDGPDKPLQPCWATITRRTERKTTQSEMMVEREPDAPELTIP